MYQSFTRKACLIHLKSLDFIVSVILYPILCFAVTKVIKALTTNSETEASAFIVERWDTFCYEKDRSLSN